MYCNTSIALNQASSKCAGINILGEINTKKTDDIQSSSVSKAKGYKFHYLKWQDCIWILNVADQQFLCASVENKVIMFTVVPLQVVENKAVSTAVAVAGIKLVNCPKVTLFIPISFQSCNPWPRPQTSHRSEPAGKKFWGTKLSEAKFWYWRDKISAQT